MPNLQVVIQAKDEFSKTLQGMAAPIGGLVSSLGAIGLASVGIDSISGAIHGFIDDALEAQNVQSQLNAVLKSTHGAAGMTADAINAISDSLSKVTAFDDEAIGGAQNLLLTFTSIGKDVFPQATEAILNMSQSLGQDLQSSTIQLGKALNDPIKGITALSRVGVSFTDAQKKMIEQMVKAGNVAGAQKVILKELDTEFGNSARAAGTTFAGKLAILNTQIGNVKETIGGALIPVLSTFATGLTDALPKVTQFGGGVISAVQDLVHGGSLDQLFADLNDHFVEAFDVSPGDILANLGSYGQTAINWIIGELPAIEAQLSTWGQAFIAWIGPLIPPFLVKLADLGTQLFNWIISQDSAMVARLASWGQAFIAWIGPMIPPFLAEVGKLATQLWQWIQDQSKPIGDKFGEWAQEFAKWIPGAVKNFLDKWPDNLNKILDQIEIAAPKIATQLVDWAKAFINFIGPKIPDILLALGGVTLAIVDFIVVTAVTLGDRLKKWAAAFIDWVGPQIPLLKAELGKLGDMVAEWIKTQAIVLGDLAYDWGKGVATRFIKGFEDWWTSPIDLSGLGGTGLNDPRTSPSASAPSGSVSGYSSSGGDIHVHIYGNSPNPSDVQSAATTGVLAANRAMGY